MEPATPKRRWLKWAAIFTGGLLILMAAAIAWMMFRPSPPSRVETISENWAIDYYDPLNPDGLKVKHLARRGARRNRDVSGNLAAYRYVGDDCVIYSDWDSGLYGICGEGMPLYVGFAPREAPPDLQSDPITVEDRQIPIAEIKHEAATVSEESPGGHWRAQRQAFPGTSNAQELPRHILFHDEGGRLVTWAYRVPQPMLAYRYLGEDCLLYVNLPVESQAYPVAASCGKRYEVYLGRVMQPSEALSDPPVINGQTMPASEIRKKAMAERERY